MKKLYTIETFINSVHFSEYDLQTKKTVDKYMLLIDKHGEENPGFLYRTFRSKKKAKASFKTLCTFCTSDNIELKFIVSDITKDNLITNDKELISFHLKDENNNFKKLKKKVKKALKNI